MQYKLAIFDFDGTLADSADWMFHAMNRIASRHKFRQISPEELPSLRGCSNREIIKAIGISRWRLPLVVRHMRKLSCQNADQIQLFDGVPLSLQTIAKAGITLAIVSSSSERYIRKVLGLELSSLIGHYECGVSLYGKAPRIRRTVRRIGVANAEAVYIGDETRDVEAAKAAGIDSCAVLWGYATAALLEEFRPTVIFPTIDEMVALLTGQRDPVARAT